jgi:hypothetical protein
VRVVGFFVTNPGQADYDALVADFRAYFDGTADIPDDPFLKKAYALVQVVIEGLTAKLAKEGIDIAVAGRIRKGAVITHTELRALVIGRAQVEAEELGLSEGDARTHVDMAFLGVKCMLSAADDAGIVFVRPE